MVKQESKNHHFVPQFLLRPWLVESPPGHCNLRGYWWDSHQGALNQKLRGLKSFCVQMDLLTLSAYNLGRDAIERLFFGEIDTKGADARNILINEGPTGLTGDQRCDFTRLLLSLEARRPGVVTRLRMEGKGHLASELNADPLIRAAMAEQGISDTPSSYVEKQLKWSLEDRALINIQALVDNPKVGGRLINSYWDLRRLDGQDGSLVLSDRPLIRIHGYDQPGASWILPLKPHVAFIACNDLTNLTKLMKFSGQRFIKEVNKSSAAQVERFVFSIDPSHALWLSKCLKIKA
ncbi:MAG: DUF4238 domain-containing protein [Alphaproteobacteria bacterium]|nr:DUF4238 domain-containing protein [Alphaproteobacteria bacterium]